MALTRCRMQAHTKLILAKVPIVLIFLFLCLVDTSDEGPALKVAGWGAAHYLHALVVADLILRNATVSKVYYSLLAAFMAWSFAPMFDSIKVPLDVTLPLFLIGLSPYLLVIWVLWRTPKTRAARHTSPGTLDSMPG